MHHTTHASLLRRSAVIVSAGLAAVLGAAGGPGSPASAQTSTAASKAKTTRAAASYDKVKVSESSASLSVAFAAPKGALKSLSAASEIRWLFDRPVVDLTQADTVKATAEIARRVVIQPSLRGTYRWASTRMLVFTPFSEPGNIRAATTYTVTLSGLSALDGTSLSEPAVLSFSTPTPECRLGSDVNRERPGTEYLVSCSQPVDETTLVASASLVYRTTSVSAERYRPTAPDLALMSGANPEGAAKLTRYLTDVTKRPAIVATRKAVSTRIPEQCSSTACYVVAFEGSEPFDAVGHLEVGAGVRSPEGPLLSRRIVSGRIPTSRTPLVVTRGCRVACDPDSFSGLEMIGADYLSAQNAAGLISVQDVTGSSNGTTVTYEPKVNEDGDLTPQTAYPLGLRWAAMRPGRTYRITLDEGLVVGADQAALGYRSITTIGFGHRGAFALMSSGEVVVRPGASGLAMRSQNVTEMEKVDRRLNADDLVSVVRTYNGFMKSPGLKLNAERSTTVALKTAVDKAVNQALPFGKKGEKGVYLVAIRAKSYVDGSRYSDNGTPLTKEKAAALDKRNQKDATVTHTVGNGWTSRLVQRTDLGVTMKMSPANVHVAVSSIADGKAVPGAKVALYSTAKKKPFFTGTTDAQGFLTAPIPADLDDTSTKAAPADDPSMQFCESCALIAVVSKDDDLAYAQSNWQVPDGWSYYGYRFEPADIHEDEWKLAPGEYRTGSLFTDRGVYKVGEQVHVKGVVRASTLKGLAIPNVSELTLTMTDPQGLALVKPKVKVSANGTFDTTVAVPAAGAQGRYILDVAGASTAFLVSSYRKPDFVVDVTTRKPAVVLGAAIQADVDARYLFGAPMGGAAATTAVRGEWDYRPAFLDSPDHPELQDYTWTFPCLDADQIDCGLTLAGETLLETKDSLDSTGHLSVNAQTDPNPVRHPGLVATVESEVVDVSRQAFADRVAVRVDPSSYQLGIKTDGFGVAGKKLTAHIVSVNNDGSASPGRAATVELVWWEWVLARSASGDYTGRYVMHSISKQQITTATAPVSVDLAIPRAGTYEIRVYGTDELGNAVESAELTYAAGPGYVAWPDYDSEPEVTLRADKNTYQVGDQALILIRSPWEKAEGLLTIERGGVLENRRISLRSSASTVSVPIGPDAPPNVYVNVNLFAPAPSSSPTTTAATADTGVDIVWDDPQVLSATLDLLVPPTAKALTVKLATQEKTYLPGSATSVDVQLADAAGKPASGEVTLWAVDEGVLRLTGYTTPDLLSEMYAERENLVSTADSRQLLARRSDDKGDESASEAEPGGGGGDSSTGDSVRADFRTLAVWSGAVSVDASGKANVPIKLPDSLTTYRIMAVAVSGADRFGAGQGSVTVNKALMVQPALPRFVNVGDTFKAGVVVFNRTGTTAPVTVTVTRDGDALTPAGPLSFTTPPIGDKPVEVSFAFEASKVGKAPLTFTATIGDGGTGRSDAVAASIPVSVTQRLTTVATSGSITATSSGATGPSERVVIPAEVLAGMGTFEVAASTSSLAGLQNSISGLVEYPYGCLEQRTSILRVLLELSRLDQTFGLKSLSKPTIDAAIKKGLRDLRQFQTSTGMTYWPGDYWVDPYLSARTLILLQDARAAGYSAPAGMINGLIRNLQGGVGKASNTDEDYAWQYSDYLDLGPTRALAAYALARSAKPEKAMVDSLYESRYQLAFTEQVYLLRAMLEAGETGARPNTLYGDLLSSVRVENNRAFVQDDVDLSEWPGLWYLYGSNHNAALNTGALLSLMTRTDPRNALVPMLARWLVENRTNGEWQSTLESGVALHGLMEVAQRAETADPDVTASILLGSRSLLSQRFDGRTLEIASASQPIASLVGESTQLSATAKGKGQLFWSARLRYALPSEQLQPLDNGFTILRSYRLLPAVSASSAGTASTAPKSSRSAKTTKKTATTKAAVAIASSGPVSFKAGDLVVVTLRILSPQQRTNVAIEDLLPAGFEALNAALTTTSQRNLRSTSEDPSSADARSTWAAGINHTEVRDDRVQLFATQLDAGEFTYTYVARATTPGRFVAPPAVIEEMYHPEVSGRTASQVVTVTPGA